jgi:hypothetical protein
VPQNHFDRIEDGEVVRVRDQERVLSKEFPVQPNGACSSGKRLLVHQRSAIGPWGLPYISLDKLRKVMRINQKLVESGAKETCQPVFEQRPSANRGKTFRKKVREWPQSGAQTPSQ